MKARWHIDATGLLWYKTISETTDSNDMDRFLAVILDLSTEPVDVDHDGIVIYSDSISPDMFVDHIFGKNLLRMFHKHEKKGTFLGRKDQFFSVFVKTHGRSFVGKEQADGMVW